jgi:hypothetical protein
MHHVFRYRVTLAVLAVLFVFALLPIAFSSHTVSAGGDTARVRLAHLASFAQAAPDTEVVVTFSGEFAPITPVTLRYSDSTPYQNFPAGVPILVEVTPVGASEPAITGTVTLTPTVDFTLAAIGNGSNFPLELLVIQEDNTPVPGSMKVRVVHAAPFSNTVDGTRVDVRGQNGGAVPGLSNLPYRTVSGYIPVPSQFSPLNLIVTAPGGTPLLYDVPPIELVPAEVLTAILIGDNVNQPLTVLFLGDGEEPTSITLTRFDAQNTASLWLVPGALLLTTLMALGLRRIQIR